MSCGIDTEANSESQAESGLPPALDVRESDSDGMAPRPAWNNAAIWMGGDFVSLARLFHRHAYRIRPQYLLDALIDLTFGLANSTLGVFESALFEREINRVKLAQDPLFIIGHWRTGTTLLHELLASDARNRCPNTYECFVPHHFVLTERWLKSWSGFVLPPNRPFDNMAMGWDLPQEDEFALLNLGAATPYRQIAFPNDAPADYAALDLEGLQPAELRRWKVALSRFVRQLVFLKAGQVVLKSPPHTCRLPVLAEMFPRARFVNMVRDPFKVFPSTVRLWKGLYSSHGYQLPTFAHLEEQVFETFAHMHQRLEATRGQIARENLFELRYEDLVRDPLGKTREIYEHFGLGDFAEAEPAMRDYLDRKSDYVPNRHMLRPELRSEIVRRWRPYFDRYGYRTEPRE